MFTGIIDHVGTVLKVDRIEGVLTLQIESKFKDLDLGESIAVDGACLTVKEKNNNYFSVDISEETLKKTISKFYEVGSQVNLERSLRVGDRLSGHFVLGHVDQIAPVKLVQHQNEFTLCEIVGFLSFNKRFVVPKGSIAINGVSLTLNEVKDDGALFMWIPHTLAVTNLKNLKAGSMVNVEFDYLAKILTNQK